MSNRPVRVQKRLLQFNSLPFAFGEIKDQSYAVTFKGESQTYTNSTHGAYYPTLGESGKLQSSTFRASIDIDFHKIACEEKVRYARFIKRQLSRSGKLWAVQNAVELIWTNARVIDITESVDDLEDRDVLRLEIQFELFDGVWRLAKRTRTFLCTNYCPNRFQDFDDQFCEDLYDYEGVCEDDNCHACIPADYHAPEYQGCIWRPICSFAQYKSRTINDPNGQPFTTIINGVEKTIYPKITLPSLYDLFGVDCANQCFINYSCKCEKEQFCYDDTWGREFKLLTGEAVNTTCFTFCSRTDLPTTAVRVRLLGAFEQDTRITINGDTVRLGNSINASDNMVITIGHGPIVYVVYDDGTRYSGSIKEPMRNGVDITPNTWRSNTPTFQINPGKNYVEIYGNKKGFASSVFIDPIELTF